MALTAEQQAQVDMQLAIENARQANMMAYQAKIARLDAVRLAKETLIENSRSLPVEQRTITAASITAFADQLVAYVNA